MQSVYKIATCIPSEKTFNHYKGGNMNFENLKGVMGEAYHEGITAEEVNTFFADKNFADLSTGQYVDKNKYDRDIQALNTTIAEKQNALNAKLTDDEKASQAREADKEKIKELTALLQQNTITSNKTMAGGLLAQAKSILGLKDDDADYGSFIDSIVSDDANKTNSIAKYVAKLTKDAYEKGKQDAIKDKMGQFGNQHKGDGNDGSDDVNNLGKQLAKASMSAINKEQVDYFKR